MAIRNQLDLTRRKPGQDGIALRFRRAAVDMLGAHAGGDELIAQMNRVLHVDREGDSLAPLAELQPMRDDIADQFRLIHAIGELDFDIVAGLDLDAFQIWSCWCIYPGPDQVLAFDQFGDLRELDDLLEDPTEPSTITSTWRCSQARSELHQDKRR